MVPITYSEDLSDDQRRSRLLSNGGDSSPVTIRLKTNYVRCGFSQRSPARLAAWFIAHKARR
jgi:hypothetical protein